MSVKSPVYDCVLSLGQWCATAVYLRKLGLRSFSGPFDWLGPTTELPVYVDTLCGDFVGFMAKENLRFLESDPIEGTDHYEDRPTGLRTHHEFVTGVDFDANYRNYRTMLQRRIDRFRRCFDEGKRILLVHFHGEGRYEAAEVLANMQRLRAKYPAARIDLLLLEVEKHRVGLVRETLEAGVERVTGDFYDRARFNEVMGNEKLVVAVLKGIRMRGKFGNLLRVGLQSLARRLSGKSRRRGAKGGRT